MDAVVSLSSVSVVRGGHPILRGVDWAVRDGERWVILGPNGAGKTTLTEIASLYLYPSSGVVTVLGEVHGRTDVRRLRGRIGYASAALAKLLHPNVTALEAVATGRAGVLDAYWAPPSTADLARAQGLLATLGCRGLERHELGTLSEGERQRVQIARALMASPELLILDEPAAGLDLGARATLVQSLESLACDAAVRAIAFVTHHVEEIPAGFGHALLLRAGRVLASGPIEETLTASAVSACFGLPLAVGHTDGRWTAWAEGAGTEHATGWTGAAGEQRPDHTARDPGTVEEPRPAGTGEPSARGAADRFVLDPDGRRKAYRPLPLSTRRGALEAFLETYMARRYFDAHEILEPAWMGTDDPAERALHQGLIKVAAAGVHASRGNARGAVQNLEGALRRLLIAADAATAVSPSEGDAEAPFAEVDGAGARNAPRAAGLVSMLGLVDLKAVVRWAEAAIELLRRPGADPEALARVTAFLAAAPAPARLETPDVAQRADQGPSPIPVQSTVRRQADAEPA